MENLSALSADLPLSLAGHRIVEAASFAQVEPYLEAWERLAHSASEANVFYAPWALRPALEYLCRDKTVKLLLFLREDCSEPALDGVLPLLARPLCNRFPVYSLHSLQHRYCFSTAPLVRAGQEDEVANSLALWLHRHRHRYPVLQLRWVSVEGVWAQALRQRLQQLRMGFRQSCVIQRALLIPEDDQQTYLQRALTGKKLRKYQRLRESLAEQGELQIRELQPGEANLQAWLDAFVELELSGWKGRQQTAIGSRPACRRFFEALAGAAHARGQLAMLSLTLGGRPLAMLCDFLAPPGAFAFKSAYDEAFARFAPGVLLELENVSKAHARKARGLQWLDSCSAPDNELLNRLYLERRTLCNLTISSGSALANLYVASLPVLKRFRQRLKHG